MGVGGSRKETREGLRYFTYCPPSFPKKFHNFSLEFLYFMPKLLKPDIKRELILRELSRRKLLMFSAKVDPLWQNNWHLDVLAHALERVEKGDLKRLIVSMPPRHGKSQLTSINFPAWYLGRNPRDEIVVASYTGELAIEFGRKTRDLLDHELYKPIFSTKLNQGSQSAQRWNTDAGGGYFAVGVGGSLTGRGAKILIIDDILSGREDAESQAQRERVWNWYTSTAYTRLAPGGAVVIVMTRWHDDDLVGRLLQQEQKERDKPGGPDSDFIPWEVISFPAIAEEDEPHRISGEALWPARFPLSQLQNIRGTIGTYEWSALYQQDPLDAGSQEFKREMFQYKTLQEVQKKSTRNFLTIDPAVSKKDSADNTGFTVNLVDSENRWHFISWKEKLSPGDLIAKLFDLQDKWKLESIGIEHGMYSMVVKPFLQNEMMKRQKFLRIVELQHNGAAKEIRIRALLPRYEANSIVHIEGLCNDLEDELLRFPKARHDDVSDSASYQVQLAPLGGSVQFAGTENRPKFQEGFSTLDTRKFSPIILEEENYEFPF